MSSVASFCYHSVGRPFCKLYQPEAPNLLKTAAPLLAPPTIILRSNIMHRPQLLSFALVLVCLVTLLPTSTQAQPCSRESSNKDETPDFVCIFNVTFERQTDCSAFITESFTLPHTTGKDFRVIPTLDDLQGVSDLSASRDGVNITNQTAVSASNRDNQVRIEISSFSSSDPVRFELRYVLSNAVLRYTESCGSDMTPDPSTNVMRWRLENALEQRFENVRVTFQTENDDATLSVLGGIRAAEGSNARMQTVEMRNVDDTTEIYVQEEGVSLCRQNQRCFPDGPNVGVIVGLSVAGAAVAIVIVACIIGCCCTRRLKERYEEAQQEGEA
eukprot:GFKZ01004114.1.p1 GENE.GFKZ01004114.1~~GFKZ01004114.1.p1  ORF type:complete len:361 (+),score=26.38 GFKZ01004114.1:99-1085(+)